MREKKYLIINGDDFGYSREVNQAIIQAHQQGILTSTSLMVTGEAHLEAVKLAQENPHLGVGLHLVLVCGKSALPPQKIPHLVNSKSEFSANPFLAGLNYYFNPQAQQELKLEIREQLTKFRATGLPMSHLDGHLHLHTHPTIINILAELVPEFGIKYVRLPEEELSLNLAINKKNIITKIIYSQVFKRLKNNALEIFKASKIKHIEKVYGLLETSNINEDYLLRLIPKINNSISEIYSHPNLSDIDGQTELNALISSKIKNLIQELEIQLINYHQLEEIR
jgi:hopanoid biosynthesis associated protein HpnK